MRDLKKLHDVKIRKGKAGQMPELILNPVDLKFYEDKGFKEGSRIHIKKIEKE